MGGATFITNMCGNGTATPDEQDSSADYDMMEDDMDEEQERIDEGSDDDYDDPDFALEGYNDLLYNDDDDDDDSSEQDTAARNDVQGEEPRRKKLQPAFYERSTRAAQRSALRTQVNASESFLISEDPDVAPATTSRVPGTFGRRNRANHDPLPAYHKKVTADLDSDDELMMNMREKGYSDRQIADRLAKDGRIRYDVKSISTRIGRIRLAQGGHVDYLLNEGYKEWEYEEDHLLMQAYDLADIEVRYEIERIRAWRFRKVSDYMRRLNKDVIYSAKACRERYQALVSGTATIPTELDDNPEQRRADMEMYREERERIREAELREKETNAALRAKIKEETRARYAQKQEEVAIRRADYEQRKTERIMQRAAQQQVKNQRIQDNKLARIERNAQIKAQRAAEETAKKQAAEKVNPNARLHVSRLDTFSMITDETPDPRGSVSFDDLGDMCIQRGLSAEGRSKEELVQRLRDADDEYSLNDLRKMVRSRGLNVGGNKMQMKYTLALALAKIYASFGGDVDGDNGTHDTEDVGGSEAPCGNSISLEEDFDGARDEGVDL